MLRITVTVNRPPGQAIGVKEQIAMDLERYGDTRVVMVEEMNTAQERMEQMRLDDMRTMQRRM